MGYYIDLSKISLNDYKEKLLSGYLLASQQILKEKINERFELIKTQNIENVHQLQQVLKTKNNVKSFSLSSSIPFDYLIVLRREVNSYHPQPRKINDFPCLSEELKKNLNRSGIKTTVDLFDKIKSKNLRDTLKKELNISKSEVLQLAKLTDVSRVRYVNQTFATLLVNSNYDTIEKISKANYIELFEHLKQLNDEKHFFKGRFELNDMKYFINDCSNISLDIEY